MTLTPELKAAIILELNEAHDAHAELAARIHLANGIKKPKEVEHHNEHSQVCYELIKQLEAL